MQSGKSPFFFFILFFILYVFLMNKMKIEMLQLFSHLTNKLFQPFKFFIICYYTLVASFIFIYLTVYKLHTYKNFFHGGDQSSDQDPFEFLSRVLSSSLLNLYSIFDFIVTTDVCFL